MATQPSANPQNLLLRVPRARISVLGAGASTDHREEGDSTDRLALAIRLASTAGSGK